MRGIHQPIFMFPKQIQHRRVELIIECQVFETTNTMYFRIEVCHDTFRLSWLFINDFNATCYAQQIRSFHMKLLHVWQIPWQLIQWADIFQTKLANHLHNTREEEKREKICHGKWKYWDVMNIIWDWRGVNKSFQKSPSELNSGIVESW